MLTLRGPGTVDQTAALLQADMPNAGVSCELVTRVDRNSVCLLIYEKYYMRNSSRATLTVLISEKDGEVTVDAVASGAGSGSLFNFDWGAAEDFEDTVRRSLTRNGFS